jgi:hypothetical protein
VVRLSFGLVGEQDVNLIFQDLTPKPFRYFFAAARAQNLWVSFSHDDKVAAARLAQEDGKTARLEETIGIRTS